MIWQFVFWTNVILIIYIYFGYPTLLWLLGRVKRKQPDPQAGYYEPTMSLIITAHNEERVIGEKLKNALGLDYPADRLEILVASDCSTDRTNEIVREYNNHGVILNAIQHRGGKTAAQNQTVPLATGEIIVFSDANSMYAKDALRKLVRNFRVKSVGAVSGRLAFTNTDDTSVGAGEGLYWRYENFLRRLESEVGSCIMANASIFAIRKELFLVLDPGFSEDFVLPLRIATCGKRVIFEPEAICYEKVAATSRDEFDTKIRAAHMDSYGLLKLNFMLSPLRPFLFFQCISHKLLRWFVGYFLIALFIANLFLLSRSYLYKIAFVLQIVFFTSAIVGFFFQEKGIKSRLFYIPYYFCLVNLAATVGALKGILGRQLTKWEKAETAR